MQTEQVIQQLKQQLSRALPGEKAHQRLSPPQRLVPTEERLQVLNPKIAAVMAILYPSNIGLETIFIKRASYPGVHSDQISFPGGKKDPSDETLVHTALRETEEEIGLPAQRIEVLGSLSRLYIPPSNFLVHPFVGFYPEKPKFVKQQREVKDIIVANTQVFRQPNTMQYKIIQVNGRQLECPAYRIKDDLIWGATAMILAELLEIIPD